MKPIETIFECRCCGDYTPGLSNGFMTKPGWKRIAHIDGRNAICPECQHESWRYGDLQEEYPNMKIVENIVSED
jgi:hypothetical protein